MISDFDNFEDFKSHIYFHGTTNAIDKGLKPSITMTEKQAETYGGGGYGQRYFGISLTKSKKVAESFAGMKSYVNIYPVILKKDAKVISKEDLSDASEVEDIIVDLYNQNVDAVWIGGGEQELVVINPYAVSLYKKGVESFQAYGGFKSVEPSDEKLLSIYNKAKKEAKSLKEEFSKITGRENRENFLKNLEKITFQKEPVKLIPTGFVKGNKVYLNSDVMTLETPVHEFAHLYNKALKQNNPKLYNRGLELVRAELENKNSPIKSVIDYVKQTQPNLEGEALEEEILTQLTGKKGLELLESKKKSGIIDWIKEALAEIANMLGLSKYSIEEAMNMTIEEYAKAIAVDLLKGEKLYPKATENIGTFSPINADIRFQKIPTEEATTIPDCI
jgi:hypothetical protein